ncbi:MAG TPA: nitronate monooxygenase, partial [Steroidobacteraceae bacterium]|nr:nitronate monooxygenase [Steroidobacteraceae bacterium]
MNCESQHSAIMWTRTRVTEKLNIKLPIIQGPFGGGPSSIALAAAVSNAGGLGSFGAYALSPEQIKKLVVDLRAHTANPFAINLWIPFAPAHEKRITEAEYLEAISRLQPYYKETGV